MSTEPEQPPEPDPKTVPEQPSESDQPSGKDRPPWYRRPRWIVPLALVVVVAVAVTAVLVVIARRDTGRPFREAVAALTASPVLHTSTSLGGARMEQRVTAGGDALGRMSFGSLTFDTMTVGGRTYVKAPAALAGSLAPGGAAASLAGRWVTGGSSPLTASLAAPLGPVRLGALLGGQLEDATFPGVFDRGTELDGVRVLKAELSGGDLYVTSREPYRVVRFAAKKPPGLPNLPEIPSLPEVPSRPEAPSLPALPKLPSMPGLPKPPSMPALPDLPELPGLPGGFLRATLRLPLAPAVPSPAPAAASFDMVPMSPADFDQTFTDLADAAGELTDAVDADVKFDVRGDAQVVCGPAGCVVTVRVSNTVAGTGQATVRSAQVNAQMIATIMVNGRIAGTATSAPTPIPANGTGTISGTSPQAGAVYQAAAAAARGRRGVTLIAVTGTAEVVATAQVQAEVQQQVRRIERDRQLTLRGPPGAPLRDPRNGTTDGGPGSWVDTPPNRYAAPGSTWGSFQERATGVTRAKEYLVDGVNYNGRTVKVHFDGFENGILIDAKDNYDAFFDAKTGKWKFFFTVPSKGKKRSGLDELIDEARRHSAAAGGTHQVEWRSRSCAFAALLSSTLVEQGIYDIRVRCFP
ncbi:Tox-REase-5 domain-containing protein [Actinoplanes sp. DH11]|uniref:Tox-REase-5 domain-containing protein n=1 Tax=Actinoplanes sp. DH11 TaxID=2857011 RepID=UPI00271523D0|nr:Tox-REase-5 domain-containing protein [Actinoplanes sp. DH11]